MGATPEPVDVILLAIAADLCRSRRDRVSIRPA
jgi:hypothetical protein